MSQDAHYMIRKARLTDLASIKNLTESCAIKMQENGIFQWNEYYPSLERLQNDIEQQELYLIEENQKLQGIIVLTSKMDEEYHPIKWLTPNGNNLYVHRLATNPQYWGRGYGGSLWISPKTLPGQMAILLSDLIPSVKIFGIKSSMKARGYQKLGNIYFPKQSEHPFHCYELVLNNHICINLKKKKAP